MFKAITSLVGGGILGKLLGIGRELLLAFLFGTSKMIDAYRAALVATMLPTHLFTSDTLNAIYIPLHSQYMRESPERAPTLFWVVSALLMTISLVLTAVLVIYASFWVSLLVPGFDSERQALCGQLLRITALGIPFYVQSALFAYLEIGNGRYALASARASVQSFGLIAGTLAAYFLKSPQCLAWGFTLTYAIYCCIIGYRLWNKKVLSGLNRDVLIHGWTITKRIWQIARSLLLLPLFMQGNLAVERMIASKMGVGGVSSLDYARVITDSGILLLANPLGMAGLGLLGSYTPEAVREKLSQIVSVLLVLLVPSSVYLYFNAETVVRLLYSRGAFTENSVHQTTAILTGIAVGLWAQIVAYVMLKALNARFMNIKVMIYMVIGILINIGFNLVACKHIGLLGLGLGASINGMVVFVLCAHTFNLWQRLRSDLVTLVVASLAYGAGMLYLNHHYDQARILCLAIGAVYWLPIVAWLMKKHDLHKRFLRSRVA